MKINQKNNGSIIGGIFMVCSILSIVTIMAPIFSVLPGALIESIVAAIIGKDPYSTVGKVTLGILFLIFAVFLYFTLSTAKKTVLNTGDIVGIMVLAYFIIHTLGFYIYWGTLNFRSDGQLAFGALFTVPISSFGLLGLGILIDAVKLKPSKEDVPSEKKV